MFTPGPRTTATPKARPSSPTAVPTRAAMSGSQLEPTATAGGKQVEGRLSLIPRWSASPAWRRIPCGPSVRTSDGIPASSIGLVDQKSRPDSSDAFCSRVRWEMSVVMRVAPSETLARAEARSSRSSSDAPGTYSSMVLTDMKAASGAAPSSGTPGKWVANASVNALHAAGSSDSSLRVESSVKLRAPADEGISYVHPCVPATTSCTSPSGCSGRTTSAVVFSGMVTSTVMVCSRQRPRHRHVAVRGGVTQVARRSGCRRERGRSASAVYPGSRAVSPPMVRCIQSTTAPRA